LKKILSGKVWKYGDNVNTDIISPPQYMELSIAEASRQAMSAVDPAFAEDVKAGDIVVAGSNFGSGSSRETSPLTLKYLGVGAVVAKFFARIFYRNAINVGVVALECPETDRIEKDDVIEIHLEEGIIVNKTKNETYPCSKIPEHLFSLLEEGGLVPHLKKELTETPCNPDSRT
jgi:3-isopropylmalate/(R)-2-methylmalate dehydratase small subunit